VIEGRLKENFMSIRTLALLSSLGFMVSTAVAHPLDGEYRIVGDFPGYSKILFRLKDLKVQTLNFGRGQSADGIDARVTDLGGVALIQISQAGADAILQDTLVLDASRGQVRLKAATTALIDLVESDGSKLKPVRIQEFGFRKAGNR
jgi:hypothetical protein